ncbi:hypothetical protein SOVF_209840, partial [Spinacia oleracea]
MKVVAGWSRGGRIGV